MSSITNVAIAGASGSLGSIVFQKLVSSGKFKVKVLRRTGSEATYPAGTDVSDVDFESLVSLTNALQGQDAVVANLSPTSLGLQQLLIDASVNSKVKRFIPSEFGSNLDLPVNQALPIYAEKVRIAEYLAGKSESTPLTYTKIYNGPFLDWCVDNNFLLEYKGRKPRIFNGGNVVFSSTTLSSAADGVVGVLSHPEETENRSVFLEDFKLTQNELLAAVKKAVPENEWMVQDYTVAEATAAANERLAKGLLDMETFAPYLYQSIMGTENGGNFEKNDNALLGIVSPSKDVYVQELYNNVLK